jgi:hypothetical protein
VSRAASALTKKTRVGGEQLDELISERQNASAQGIYFPPFLCVRFKSKTQLLFFLPRLNAAAPESTLFGLVWDNCTADDLLFKETLLQIGLGAERPLFWCCSAY